MKSIIQYQIEVAICMAAITLLYLIFWRKETNFYLKRIILLGIPLFSIIIPLINVNIDFGPKPESNTIQYITYIPNQLEMVYAPIVAEAESLSGWEIAFWLMCIGICIMIVRLLISYLKIVQIYGRSVVDISSEFRIIDDPVQSFSFFNMIVINKSQAQSGARDYILAHENAHKRQGHSWDILWLEAIKMLHWFNPIIWLLTQESRKNLEYLADQEVANSTGNLKNYQFAIVQHATQTEYQLLKTQFSKNNLKNRIIMMNQPNNYRFASWKLLTIMPLLAMLLMSFSLRIENLDIKKKLADVLPTLDKAKEIIHETPLPNSGDIIEVTESDKSSQKNLVDDQIYGIVDEYPQPAGMDRDTYIEKMSKMIKYPRMALEKNITGKVFVQFVVEKNGTLSNVRTVKKIGHGCDEAVVQAFRNGPGWIPGKMDGKKVRVQTVMPVNFITSEKNTTSKSDTTTNEIFTIVENQPYPSTGDWTTYYEEINKNLKYPEEAKEKGIEGKVFVQFIVKKDGSLDNIIVVKGISQECDEEAVRVVREGPGWIPGRQRGQAVNVRMIAPITFIGENKITGTVSSEDRKPVAGANVIIKGTPTGTVTDNNGKFILQIESDQSEIVIASVGYKSVIEKIIPGNNYEIVLERDPNTPLPQPKSISENEGLLIKANGKNIIDPDAKPLYIIDGIQMEDFDERTLDPNDIESISILKDKKSAVEKYGEKAKNGVVIIKTSKNTNKSKNNNQSSIVPLEIRGYGETEKIKIRAKDPFKIDHNNPPLLICDGIEIISEDFEILKPEKIESISILKDKKTAVEKYGEKAKNGVVIIKTKKSGGQGSIKLKNQTGRKLLGKVLNTKGEPIENAFVNIKGSSHVNTNEFGEFELYHATTQFPRIQAFKEGYLWTEVEIASYQDQLIVLPDFPIKKLKNVIDENGPQSIESNSGFKIQQYDIVISGEKVFAREPESSGNFEKFGQELGIQSIPDSAAARLFGDNARGGVNLRIMR